MTAYVPPLKDMKFLLDSVLEFRDPAVDGAMQDAILDEAAKLASEILAPLNHPGDKEGAKLENGGVKTAKGFKEAYRQYREGGWNAVPFDPEFGGQGLPWAIAFPVQEMWQAANMSFGLCPLLNQGAVEAIAAHGSPEQKRYYLPKLISGEWTGTMNLTEPQAGSDLGLIRARAEKNADGTYKIFGQKIFITYGDHDMADNIIHLVLARLPDAPEDVKGISLFIVPKFLENGARNDVTVAGIEHKLGIHASPTCTMSYGEKGGATGYLVGRENEGLKYMFTMMNNARLSVGLQGVAIAERAYQKAFAYANERVQGKTPTGARVTIAHHPDVRRMLLLMKSQAQAGRALAYEAAMALDAARTGETGAQAQVDLLTPVVKSWCTDMACGVASLGVQIHGGMGFVEETGAAQYYRDARILPIYEGANGIQAMDLVFRKIARDSGAAAKNYITLIEKRVASEHRAAFHAPLAALKSATDFMANAAKADPESAGFAASNYLNAFAIIAGGALLSLAAKKAETSASDPSFAKDKKETAHFFACHVLPHAEAHLRAILCA